MNWLEKVRYLKQRKEQRDYDSSKYYIDISCEPCEWRQDELETIIQKYPYLPENYIDFIKEFDNLGLSFVAFYGSNKGDVLILEEQLIELSEYTSLFQEDYFPFAKDVGGSIFAFTSKRQVVRFDIEDYDFVEEPELITETFEEFVGGYVLGPKGWTDDGVEDSKFYQFIKSLGWIK